MGNSIPPGSQIAQESERLDLREPLGRRWVRWALVIGFWTFFGALFGTELYLTDRFEGGTLTLPQTFIRHLAWAYTWALFTPIVLWLRKRFPFERHRWRSSLAVHLVMSLLLALLASVVFALAGQLTGRYPGGLVFLVDRSVLLWATWLHMDPFLYWIIVGLSYATQYYRESRERQLRASQLETQLTQARLQALEMQLHPHFLFNALHTIAVLVRTDRNAQAVRVVTGLAELLRRALDRAGAQLVPLKQEIEFIRRYLEIEQIRFGERLKVDISLGPGTQDAQVPYLILQPLVENAIQHGIAPRTSAGSLRIEARRDAGRLHLSVWNDGPGLREGPERSRGNGVGLPTTKERLQQLYGDDHDFVIENAEGGGVAAVIDLPFRFAAEAVEGEA